MQLLVLVCQRYAPSTADSIMDGWGAIILADWLSLSLPCRTGVPSAECGSGGDSAYSAWVGTDFAQVTHTHVAESNYVGSVVSACIGAQDSISTRHAARYASASIRPLGW